MNNKDYYIYIEVILKFNNAVRRYEDSRSDYDFLNLYAIAFRTIYRYFFYGCGGCAVYFVFSTFLLFQIL